MVGLAPKGKFVSDGEQKSLVCVRKGTHNASICLLFNKGMEVSIYKMNLKVWDPNYLRERASENPMLPSIQVELIIREGC